MLVHRPNLSEGRLPTAPHGSTVVLAQADPAPDHFAGLDAALMDRDIWVDRILADQSPVCFGPKTRVVIIKDQRTFVARYAVEQAQRVGACVVLLMDGIVEYRNTFLNPGAGANFLRPAPADVIACAGEMDRRTLAALGNDAVATGLPRLAPLHNLGPLTDRRAIMVATANTPAFTDDERARLLAALTRIRDACAAAHIRIHWRLTGGLELPLAVTCDRRPLAQVLADVRAVIATPTTLLVESMLAGRPTILLDPFTTPCWQVAPWIIQTAPKLEPANHRPDLAALHKPLQELSLPYADIDRAIGAALGPTRDDLARQRAILQHMHPACDSTTDHPAERLADLCLDLCARPRRKSHPKRVYAPTRTPAPQPRIHHRPRVVNMVYCDGSPVGGVQTWALRLAREFASRDDLAYDVRTLLVTPQPETVPAWADDPATRTGVCVFDPTSDHTEILDTVRRSAAAFEPAIILPNFTDLCYMVAHQLRALGTRILAIAHTDHAYYQDLIRTYHAWDAAVGVSHACMQWLAPIAATRPLHQIVYGVPIAAAPRAVSPAAAPLQLMYCGRMVQEQKRIFDLLDMLDELEHLGTSYTLHMVGDGAELPAWRRELSQRTLRAGRVEFHGRREPAWVESFLSSIDVSVLVSDYEGTSVSMLEAMGAGVVPAVTHVSSGVDEWLRDGDNAVIVPLRSPRDMARRLDALARDRAALARMGHAAWQSARDTCGTHAMAAAYQHIFDLALQAPAVRPPNDLALRPHELWRWRKTWVHDSEASQAWMHATLRTAGYKHIALDRPTPGCDAVLVRSDVVSVTESEVERWRREGLGVAFSPHIYRESVCDILSRAIAAAKSQGLSRIAVFGTGKHTRARAPVFYNDPAIIGFIDDTPPPCGHMFGLPVVTLDHARDALQPDAVLLSSDAWEEKMWRRCEDLRRQGIRTIPLYNTYAETPLAAV